MASDEHQNENQQIVENSSQESVLIEEDPKTFQQHDEIVLDDDTEDGAPVVVPVPLQTPIYETTHQGYITPILETTVSSSTSSFNYQMDETVLSAKSAFKTIDTAIGEGTSAASQSYAHDFTSNSASNDGSNDAVNLMIFYKSLLYESLLIDCFLKDWEKRAKEKT